MRIASAGDVGHLTALRRTWNEEQAGGAIDDPGFAAAFHAWWESEHSTRTFFLVEVDGAVIGMANVKRYVRMPVAGQVSGGCWGYVGNVFVLEEHRNAGIGQALMTELVAWAGREGMAHVRLAPSPLSVRFYARLGYIGGAVVELDP